MEGTQPARVSQPNVEIRPARKEDQEGVRGFLVGLSAEALTRRFFVQTTPTASLVRTMVARNERRDALLATIDDVVVGHAMSFRKEETAEIAVVVADEWQSTGIGSRLVRTLLHRAAGKGVTRVGMDILGENRKVLSMVCRAWPDAALSVESGSVEVRADLTFAE